ncbi:MAG: hypothetical protein HY363_01840 [Candidatus Aenigmarchaeota archaeon]|nr:hypothetical protein [Candidatus Aenigmarchaeota archaeon]
MRLLQHIKSTLFIFGTSFLAGPNFVYSALIDALYWFLTFLIATTAKNFLTSEVYKLQPAVPNPALLVNDTAAAVTISTIRWYFIDSALIILSAFLLQIITYSACKGLIWLILLDKKPTKEYFIGFLKLNLFWWLLWLTPLLAILLGLKASFFAPVAVIAFIIYLHLTSILHIAFTEKQNIKKALTKTFVLGIGKAHHFALPYTLGIAFYLVLSQVFRLLPQDQKSMLAAGIMFLIFYLTWFRGFILKMSKTIGET